MYHSPNKQAIREKVRAVLSSRFSAREDAAAVTRLLGSDIFSKARGILAYFSMKDELSTFDILNYVLASGRTLVLPRTSSKSTSMSLHKVSDVQTDLETSKLGFKQPKKSLPQVPPEDLDLIITPGVAFDECGNRLGRGAGHYDRLLSHPGLRASIVALALDEQIVPEIPTEPHDRRVHMIFTPTRVIQCTPVS